MSTQRTCVWLPRKNRSRRGWWEGIAGRPDGLGPLDFQSPMDRQWLSRGSRYKHDVFDEVDLDKVFAEFPNTILIEASVEEFEAWAQAVGDRAANLKEMKTVFFGTRCGAGTVDGRQVWKFGGPFPFRAWDTKTCYGCGKQAGVTVNVSSCPVGIPCCPGRHRSGGSAKCWYAILEKLSACMCCGRLGVRAWEEPCGECETVLQLGEEEAKRRKETEVVHVEIPYGEFGDALEVMAKEFGAPVSRTSDRTRRVALRPKAAAGLQRVLAQSDKEVKAAHASGRNLLFSLASGDLTIGAFDGAVSRREGTS